MVDSPTPASKSPAPVPQAEESARKPQAEALDKRLGATDISTSPRLPQSPRKGKSGLAKFFARWRERTKAGKTTETEHQPLQKQRGAEQKTGKSRFGGLKAAFRAFKNLFTRGKSNVKTEQASQSRKPRVVTAENYYHRLESKTQTYRERIARLEKTPLGRDRVTQYLIEKLRVENFLGLCDTKEGVKQPLSASEQQELEAHFKKMDALVFGEETAKPLPDDLP